MSSSTPTRRRSRPCLSTRAVARLMTQRHSPLRWRMRWVLSKIGVLPATWSRIAACTRARSSGCTRLRQSGEPRLCADALESGGEARADELHQQLQVHIPRPARQRVCEREESSGPALRAQRHDQRGTDLELGELHRLSGLILARGAGIAQLREPQVLEPSLQPRKRLEARARESLRAALRESTACELHFRDAAVL